MLLTLLAFGYFCGLLRGLGGNACTAYPAHGGDQCLIQYCHRRCHAADRQHRWQYVYPNKSFGGVCSIFSQHQYFWWFFGNGTYASDV